MQLKNLEKYYLDSPKKEPYTIIFHCYENGRNFRLVSKIILTDTKLENMGLNIDWNNSEKSIYAFNYFKDKGLLSTMRGDPDLNPTIKLIKEKIKKYKENNRQNESNQNAQTTNATKEEINDLFSQIKEMLKEPKQTNWYEKSKNISNQS